MASAASITPSACSSSRVMTAVIVESSRNKDSKACLEDCLVKSLRATVCAISSCVCGHLARYASIAVSTIDQQHQCDNLTTRCLRALPDSRHISSPTAVAPLATSTSNASTKCSERLRP
eukprot:7390820-Prymnesium_polylepis.1